MQIQQEEEPISVAFLEQTDTSSINSFLNSYQKLNKLTAKLSTSAFQSSLPPDRVHTNSNRSINGHKDHILKLPSPRECLILSTQIKCLNFLTRVRTLNMQSSSPPLNASHNHNKFSPSTNAPMFMYPQWNQLCFEIKRIFNKNFNFPVKQLNSGNLLTLRPNQSLNLRVDYYMFYPHQVWTTLLALDNSDMESGTIGWIAKGNRQVQNAKTKNREVEGDIQQFKGSCLKLDKQQLQQQGEHSWQTNSKTDLQSYNSEDQLFKSLQSDNVEVEWEYGDLIQGDLIIVGRDAVYGSFKNNTKIPKYFAEMRWVKHESASNSSNSS